LQQQQNQSTINQPRNHVLDGMHIGATWRMLLNDPCIVAMQPYVKLLPPLVAVNADIKAWTDPKWMQLTGLSLVLWMGITRVGW